MLLSFDDYMKWDKWSLSQYKRATDIENFCTDYLYSNHVHDECEMRNNKL